MITDLWLEPPLAIARVGGSDNPCPNYSWSANDVYPTGTAKTTVEPREALHLGPDGRVTPKKDEPLQFKDEEQGLRPVCPFFELHGRWVIDGKEDCGPIRAALLRKLGIDLSSVIWTVRVANLKPFFYTRQRGDRIAADVVVAADDTTVHSLVGRSPDAPHPLVLPDSQGLPFGRVQVAAMSDDFPECRLRFTPPKGLVYGPRDFNERLAKIIEGHGDSMWKPLDGGPPLRLDARQLILNPDAEWPKFIDKSEDGFATNPAGLFAADDSNAPTVLPSLGLVDDISDGIVSCQCGQHKASARIVVAPPRFAPDRRPFVSIADGLTDRVRPDDVRDLKFLAEDATSREIADFFERVLETVELINVDVLFAVAAEKNRNHARNTGLHPEALSDKMGSPPIAMKTSSLPITERARQRHRRLLSLEILEDRLREDPLLIERMVRPPLAPEDYHDLRMPIGMQGLDGQPLHVTTRQYNLLVHWARFLRARTRDTG